MQTVQPIPLPCRRLPDAVDAVLCWALGQEPKANAAYALPTPDVSESSWADWIAAEAALAN